MSDDPYLKSERTAELIREARRRLKEAPQSSNNLLSFDDGSDEEAPFCYFTSTDFGVGRDPNLQLLEQELADPGFFGGDCIIKINLKDLDSIGVGVLQCIVQKIRPGVHIIVDLPRVASTIKSMPAKDPTAVRNGKSFSSGSLETRKKEVIGFLKGLGANLELMYTPSGNDLKNWIVNYARQHHISANAEVTDMIARACDNNLMVIAQTLSMMELAFIPEGAAGGRAPMMELTPEHVSNFFTKDARYTGYELPQAIFSRDSLKALNIIKSFCNGQETNVGTAIFVLLSVMDQALNVVYEGKCANIDWSNYSEKNRFFASQGVKAYTMHDDYIRAIREIEPKALDFLSHSLAEASQAYSYFDNDGALRALQRMALFAINQRAASYLRSNLIE